MLSCTLILLSCTPITTCTYSFHIKYCYSILGLHVCMWFKYPKLDCLPSLVHNTLSCLVFTWPSFISSFLFCITISANKHEIEPRKSSITSVYFGGCSQSQPLKLLTTILNCIIGFLALYVKVLIYMWLFTYIYT